VIDSALIRNKADIVVCGPEGSGTRALAVNVHRLCEPAGLTVRHLSLPLGEWWWTAEDVKGEIPIVITRRPDCQSFSAWRQGCTYTQEQAISEWPQAIATLASIPGAYWVLYEALVADAQLQLTNIAAHIGVPFDRALLKRGDDWWPWLDGNAKYLR